MPAKITHHREAIEYRWEAKLPDQPGYYWYTEDVKAAQGRQPPVWFCKIYRYKKQLWVRFFTGPYRIRLKRSRQLLFVRTRLESIPYLTHSRRYYFAPLETPPEPPYRTPAQMHTDIMPGSFQSDKPWAYHEVTIRKKKKRNQEDAWV